MLNAARFTIALVLLASCAVAAPLKAGGKGGSCAAVYAALPPCDQGCMTWNACSVNTGMTERECKDCLAEVAVEQCIVLRQVGYCAP